jgi:hypothetical protein
MIQQILELVREHSQDLILENPAIPNEKNESAIALVADSLLGGIKQMASDPSAISGLMSGASGSGLMQQMIDSAVSRMSSELNISFETANSILSQLLPRVLAGFGSKMADPLNTEFTIHGLIQHLTGAEVPAEMTSILERFISPKPKSADAQGTDLLGMMMSLMNSSEESKV